MGCLRETGKYAPGPVRIFLFLTGQIDEIRIFNRLIHEEDYLYTLLFKPSLRREQKMRLTSAHLNFDREDIKDVLENIQVILLIFAHFARAILREVL